MTIRVLDLFSGLGMFSLGLHRADPRFETIAFCERDDFCQRVLRKHWPATPILEDVRGVTLERLRSDGLDRPDLVCGGFPCQDVSINGRGAGLAGARSGLWFEFARVIEETNPGWVIIENVERLRARGLDIVLGSLAEIGYDAEWHCVSTASIGRAHVRERLFVLAHAQGGRRGIDGHEPSKARGSTAGQPSVGGAGLALRHESIVGGEDMRRITADLRRRTESRMAGEADGAPGGLVGDKPVEPWEGNTPRTVAPGYPNRRKRLIAGGNSLDPAIPEMIGRAIMRRMDCAP